MQTHLDGPPRVCLKWQDKKSGVGFVFVGPETLATLGLSPEKRTLDQLEGSD